MKKDIRNKEYAIQEVVAYYILGYRRYSENIQKKSLRDLLKDILKVARENIDTTEIKDVDINLLKRINFNWILNSDDLVSYATCIFYVLLNREENILTLDGDKFICLIIYIQKWVILSLRV